MDLLTSLFGCVGLQTNTTKTKLMTFVPGKIWAFLLDTAYRTWMDKGFCGKGKGWKVECSKYGKELEIGPLAGHLAKQHDSTSRSCWRRTGTARRLRRLGCGTRRMYYPAEGCYRFPVPGCPQGRDGSGMWDS